MAAPKDPTGHGCKGSLPRSTDPPPVKWQGSPSLTEDVPAGHPRWPCERGPAGIMHCPPGSRLLAPTLASSHSLPHDACGKKSETQTLNSYFMTLPMKSRGFPATAF